MLRKTANNYEDRISRWSTERTFTGVARLRDEWLSLIDGVDLATFADGAHSRDDETSEYPRRLAIRRKIARILRRIGVD